MGWLRDIGKSARGAVTSVTNVVRDPFNPRNFDPRAPGGFSNPVDGMGRMMTGVDHVFGARPGSLASSLGFGNQTPDWELNEQIQAGQKREYDQAVNDALADNNIDDISKAEIVNIFEQGGNVTTVNAKVAEAREGKGIYAARKSNQANAKFKADMPGRSQLLAARKP